MKVKKINVLGTVYTIHYVSRTELTSRYGSSVDGVCTQPNKDIYVNQESDLVDSTLRHEIVHAFLYESGLDTECQWVTEEMVDWLAIQLPKISKEISKVEGD